MATVLTIPQIQGASVVEGISLELAIKDRNFFLTRQFYYQKPALRGLVGLEPGN